MKNCKNCHMVVDEETECPFCHTTLTYEPKVDAEKEQYKFNKYYGIYLLKNSWCAILCTLFCVVKLSFSGKLSSAFGLTVLLLCLISLLVSLFSRQYQKRIQRVYSAEYSSLRMTIPKYFIGILAVLLSLFA